MDIQEGIDYLNGLFKKKPFDPERREYQYYDNDPNDSGCVVACVYGGKKGGKDVWFQAGGTACHGGVSGVNHMFDKNHTDVMLDHIQGGARKSILKYQTPEESVRFLNYWMTHPIFKDAFLEHDAEAAMEKRVMVRDLSSLPSNVCMLCIIACRALWESFQYTLPRRFCDLLDAGLSPDWAWIMCHYFTKCRGGFEYDIIYGSGHNALCPQTLTDSFVRNYLNHKTTLVAKGTLADGVNYCGYPRYNVNNAFEDKFVYEPPMPPAFKRQFSKLTGAVDAEFLIKLEGEYK